MTADERWWAAWLTLWWFVGIPYETRVMAQLPALVSQVTKTR